MGFEPLKYLENVTGGMGENELEKTLDIMMDLGNDLADSRGTNVATGR